MCVGGRRCGHAVLDARKVATSALVGGQDYLMVVTHRRAAELAIGIDFPESALRQHTNRERISSYVQLQYTP